MAVMRIQMFYLFPNKIFISIVPFIHNFATKTRLQIFRNSVAFQILMHKNCAETGTSQPGSAKPKKKIAKLIDNGHKVKSK